VQRLILNTFKKVKERNWYRCYWAIDLHGTCIKANYSTDEIPTEMYEHAEQTLRMLSDRSDCCLIMFTCSHEQDIKQYLELFESKDIHFDYVNENPEVPSTELENFDKKFYTNIYLDDKAGFDPSTDWIKVLKGLFEINEEANA